MSEMFTLLPTLSNHGVIPRAAQMPQNSRDKTEMASRKQSALIKADKVLLLPTYRAIRELARGIRRSATVKTKAVN